MESIQSLKILLNADQTSAIMGVINEHGALLSRAHIACYHGKKCIRPNCYYMHYDDTPCIYKNRWYKKQRCCPDQFCSFIHNDDTNIRYALMLAADGTHSFLMPLTINDNNKALTSTKLTNGGSKP